MRDGSPPLRVMLTGTEPEHCNDRANTQTALWESLPPCRLQNLLFNGFFYCRSVSAFLFDSPTPHIPTGCYKSAAFNGKHTYQNKTRLVDPVTVILQYYTGGDA